MEATNDNGGGSSPGAGAGGSSSRWNPTKEQLSMLEGLYGQGIRTPSAEQIQSITKKLQVFGHIEGKNVFYWFQNHKARQRQKQKMEQMSSASNNNNVVLNSLNNNGNVASSAAYFNRFYYPSPPVSPSVVSAPGGSHPLFHAAPHNVAYSPYYIAQPEFGFYPHCPKLILPNHLLNNSQTSTHVLQSYRPENTITYPSHNASNVGTANSSAYSNNVLFGDRSGQVTLDLFPLHPTGILREREGPSTSNGSLSENSTEAMSDQNVTPAVVQSSLSQPVSGFDVFPRIG